MRKALILGLVLVLVGWCTLESARAEEGTPRRVKVLWLGDNGHHVPLERARQVFTALAEAGIDLEYTDRLSDMNLDYLRRFDCLLVYANIERIGKSEEKAILDYVGEGHGYVPIHCGSYCFLNSPALTALTGARFKSHGTGVFKETIVRPDHPIMKGLKPIESWDETYVHEMHNPQDRIVLSNRVEGNHIEPYTWVRTYEKGRVFYTAWGHDQRTWGNEDFQALLERGIRWAAGDWALAPQPSLKPFEYAPANLPNYPAGKQWGVTGEPIKTMQLPVRPEESMKHMVVPPGFSVKLFVSDPQVKKPICMAWDERGRLWVAQTVDYPNNMQRSGEGHDQITICEDTDGDGLADKFTVFADKLSIPTSMCFANGGLVVTQAPVTLFLKDTDGDGKADVRQVLFSGWGTRDTHAGPSNMRWGFDNWIYGTCGYSGFQGTVGGQRVSFGQGIWRMKPDGSKLEFLGSTTNNTWGLGVSEDGNIFASTANRDPYFFLAIPNRYYEQVRGWSIKRLEGIWDTSRYFPIVGKIRVVDQHGNFTAGAGAALYTARTFPTEFWNRIAFMSDPTSHAMAKFIVEPKGAGYTARNNFNMFASTDDWTAPIAGEVGPDGELWMIDWYNIIVQHNPIPRGFVSGRGGAYESDLRDKRHGRVYRIIWNEGKPSARLDLSRATPEQLVGALKSDNMFWRQTAQRLLVERGKMDVIGALGELVKDQSVDRVGLNTAAIHALWTLNGLGAMEGPDAPGAAIAQGALHHPSAAVRRAAVQTLPRTSESVDAILSGKILSDPDMQVRKEALLAMSEMPASEAAGAAIFQALSQRDNAADRWVSDAGAIAAARNDASFLKAAFASYKPDPAAVTPVATPSNLLPNSSFEDGEGASPKAWRVRHYAGQATQEWVAGGRTGQKALKLTSQQGADTSWYVNVPCQPNTEYHLSAWVKTQGVSGAMGALLNVHGTDAKTNAITGTKDWTRVETQFNSGNATFLSINCLFGGWGRSTGTAWYDDVELMPASNVRLSGGAGKAISIVTGHYARRGPVESVVMTIAQARRADEQMLMLVLDALASGWPAGKTPALSPADENELRGVIAGTSATARQRLLALADRWGRRDLFTQEMAGEIKNLKALLGDRKQKATAKIDAAKKLLELEDGKKNIDLILDQLTAKMPPDVQTGLLDSISASKEPLAGKSIVAKWPSLTPTAQRTALALLLRKSAWTPALLDGLEAGTLSTKDLRAEHWQLLTQSADREIARRAQALEKSSGRAPNPDKQKAIDTLWPLVEKARGDAAHGKQVFTQNCAVCHTLEGEGGKVGPELTGLGLRPKADLIIDIIDPNRSVEGTYRQWTVETKDEILYGRLLTESRTSIEIIDASGKTHEIQRENIVKLEATDHSVMPEGFEKLGPDDMASLLEYLGTSKVKH